MTPKDSKHVAS